MKNIVSKRLVLGAAQLGSDYGIANKTGKPTVAVARQIIEAAWQQGIRELDTAQGYGDSEELIGNVLDELGITSQMRINSKFDPRLNHRDKSELSESLNNSLKKLKAPSLYRMLLHREESLDLWPEGLGETLCSFVQDGRVEGIGVSVYSPARAVQALNTKGIQTVQLPTNIFDNRFLKAGVFDLAKQKGKDIYVRSVFMQGLILMNSGELPEKVQFARQALESFENFCQRFDLSKIAVGLGYLKVHAPEAKIIFGAERPEQIQETVAFWNQDVPESLRRRLCDRLPFAIEEKYLNPSLWFN